MKIAFIGIKGLPAYGGAERVVEGLIHRLISYGVEPTVYCDRSYTPSTTRMPGVDLKRLAVWPGKYSRATTLALNAAIHATLLGRYDLIHLHNTEISFVLPILRLKYRVVATSHGAAYCRSKWGFVAKRFIKAMDWPFIWLANAATFVSLKDAAEFKKRFNHDTIYIPNGVGLEYVPDEASAVKILNMYHLKKGKYFIFVAGRIEPTKGAHIAIEAINRNRENISLLVIGDMSHVPEYSKSLYELAGRGVHFHPIIQNRETLFGLMAGATALIFPSLLEAMSMVLLEAASIGVPIICSDIPENREVMGANAMYFNPLEIEALSNKLKWVVQHPTECQEIAKNIRDRICMDYSWDTIAIKYMQIYRQVLQYKTGLL